MPRKSWHQDCLSDKRLQLSLGGRNPVWSDPESALKKKWFHPQWGLENFFSKETTPGEQKLHCSHMLVVGVGRRFFFFKAH